MSFSDITIEDYTARSIVVQGNTRKYKEDLKKLGGKYNGKLSDGPGWIFPKSSINDIESFINKGKRLVTANEEIEGEERTKQRAKEWDKSKNEGISSYKSYIRPDHSEPSHRPISSTIPTLLEYGSLINLVKDMSTKINKMDIAMSLLLSDEQKLQLDEIMNPPKKEVKKKVVKKVVKKVESDNESSDNESSDDESSESSSDEDEFPRRRLMRK